MVEYCRVAPVLPELVTSPSLGSTMVEQLSVVIATLAPVPRPPRRVRFAVSVTPPCPGTAPLARTPPPAADVPSCTDAFCASVAASSGLAPSIHALGLFFNREAAFDSILAKNDPDLLERAYHTFFSLRQVREAEYALAIQTNLVVDTPCLAACDDGRWLQFEHPGRLQRFLAPRSWHIG